jgi:hypothetical protein
MVLLLVTVEVEVVFPWEPATANALPLASDEIVLLERDWTVMLLPALTVDPVPKDA